METGNIGNNGNIQISDLSTAGTGAIIYFKPNTASNSTSSLKINNIPVYYPSGVAVITKDVGTNYLIFTLAKSSTDDTSRWILINKINEAYSPSSLTSNTTPPSGSYAGLMSAKDKAKLDGIDWGANKYTLPPAETDKFGGVKLGAEKKSSVATTPTPTEISNRYYPVQTDNNDKLIVNVPWQENTDTYYKSSIASSSSAENNVSVSITEKDKNDNEVNSSSITLKGSGIANVSTAGNTVTINVTDPLPVGRDAGKILKIGSGGTPAWENEKTYVPLSQNGNNYAVGNGYLVPGPGDNVDKHYYLRGDGNWGKELPDYSNSVKDRVLSVTSDGDKVEWVLRQNLFDKLSSENDDSTRGYLVKGAANNADEKHVLAGNGTWVLGLPPITETDYGKALKVNNSGELYWG